MVSWEPDPAAVAEALSDGEGSLAVVSESRDGFPKLREGWEASYIPKTIDPAGSLLRLVPEAPVPALSLSPARDCLTVVLDRDYGMADSWNYFLEALLVSDDQTDALPFFPAFPASKLPLEWNIRDPPKLIPPATIFVYIVPTNLTTEVPKRLAI